MQNAIIIIIIIIEIRKEIFRLANAGQFHSENIYKAAIYPL